jgi:hypothetical protein
MLSLELAKELRNAGFPNIQDLQHRQGRQFLASDGRVSFYSLGELAPPENWFIPTLEELIEACEKKEGYDHFSLDHRNSDGLPQLRLKTSKPTAGPLRRLPKKPLPACGWH